MEIRNHTPFADGLAIGLGPGREPCLSVIVKGTYAIPEQSSDAVELVEEQRPVATEDEYYNGDITGSVRIETDNVPYKPRTDVVVVGTAYAPGGEPVRQLDVSLRVGRRLHNVVRVFGDRKWVFPTRMAAVPRMTDTAPFVEMPLIYERAFGGMDYKSSAWCPFNFIGRGFIGKKTKEAVDRTPLPNLEDPNDLISSWDDEPRPVGFGFYRKDWQPRAGYVGTEEGQEDADEQFGLPSDFQFDFYNGAHPYLQVEGYLQGDEEIELRHFTPDEYRRFSLPGIKPEVGVERYEGPGADASPEADVAGMRTTQTEPLTMNLDTFVLLPDEGEFYLVWRGCTPLPEKKLDDMDFSEFAAIDIRLDSS
jgi:hypothetical protein